MNVKNGQFSLVSGALEPMCRHLSDGVIVRGRDGIVLYGNPAAEKAFGVGCGELAGRALDELIPASAVTIADGVCHVSLPESILAFHADAGSACVWPDSFLQPVTLADGTECDMLVFRRRPAGPATIPDDLFHEHELLLTIANNIPFGIYVQDVDDDFRFIRANQYFAQTFRVAHPDVFNKTPADILPPPVAAQWREQSLKTAEAGGQARTFRLQMLDEKGFPQFVHFTESLYVDPANGRRLILGTAEDITGETFFHKYDAANAEILRRTQQETDMKTVLSVITEIIFREFKSCRMVWMNREMDTQMDFVRQDMAGKLPELTPELRDKLVGYMRPILKEKHFCEIPEIAYVPELAAISEQCPGYPRCQLAFEIFNQKRYIGTMLIQFTERMPFPAYNLEPRLMLVDTFSAILYRIREQENLADSKRLLEQIIDALPMSFFVQDADDSFRYTMCNRRFCRMIGRTKEQVVGKTDHDFFPKQIADMIAGEHTRVAAAETMSHAEIEEEIPGVGWHAFEKWLLPFRTEQGRRMLIGLNHDVTEENKLRRTETLKMNLISFLNDDHGIDEFCDYMAEQMLETMHCDRILLLPAAKVNAAFMKEWARQGIPRVGEHSHACPLLTRCRENRGEPVLAFEDADAVYADAPELSCKAKSAMIARITVRGRFWGGIAVHYVNSRTRFDAADIQMLQVAASLFSMAMERSLAQKEIQRRERENQLLVDNTIIPVAMFDGAGRLLRCNRPYQESIAPVEHEVKPQLLQSIMNGLRTSSIQRKINGKIWQIDAHGVTEDSNRLSYIFMFAVDTTESVRRIRRQEASSACMEAILSEADEDSRAFQEVIRVVAGYFSADGGNFIHFRPDGMELLASWGFADSDQSFFRNMPKDREYTSTDNDWMSRLDGREITVENDIQNYPIEDPYLSQIVRATRMGTRCSFRLTHGDRVWGAVSLYFKDPWRSFSQTDYEMLGNFQHTANMMLLKYELTQNLKMERDKAISAEKAKSFFFSCVSHDIRTPLNSIIGFSELLRQGGLSQEKSVEYLGNIIFSGNTLMQLINDVLDFAALDAGKLKLYPAMCDFRRLAESVLTVVGDVARDKALFLELDAPGDLPWLNLDAQRVSQILFNLIGNAVKFTEKGGVTLHIRFTPDAGTDADAKAKKTGMLVVTVQDTGIGIEKKHFDDLLQPFVRIHTKTPTGGTGLGLSICNLMAAKMGGRIRIDSEVGVGSSFSVELPHVEYQTDAPADVEQPGEQKSESLPSELDLALLLVDDAALNLKVLEALCRKLGVRKVETASSGQEALAKMNDAVFDAVLTDVWMPNMNGDVLAAEIRRNPAWRDLPIYALTADVEMQKKENPAPFTGILLKPLRTENITDLLLKISAARKHLSVQ
jgi:PAS domain S-box-containing protein